MQDCAHRQIQEVRPTSCAGPATGWWRGGMVGACSPNFSRPEAGPRSVPRIRQGHTPFARRERGLRCMHAARTCNQFPDRRI
jgi:hypothetical protein